MRTILTMLLAVQIFAALALTSACALDDGEDYPLAIPDTTDGPDEAVIEQDQLPAGGTVHKATRAQALQYCYEVQYQHYSARSGCWNTYYNDVWLQQAYQSCVDNMNNNVTDACVNQYANYVYWLTRRAFFNVPPPGYWYGDKYRWYCLGGWPALSTPNDTGALYNAWLTCEPNI